MERRLDQRAPIDRLPVRKPRWAPPGWLRRLTSAKAQVPATVVDAFDLTMPAWPGDDPLPSRGPVNTTAINDGCIPVVSLADLIADANAAKVAMEPAK